MRVGCAGPVKMARWSSPSTASRHAVLPDRHRQLLCLPRAGLRGLDRRLAQEARGHRGLLPGRAGAQLVADRRLAHRLEYFHRALRGPVGPGLRHRARHRELRVDGRGHDGAGGALLPAPVPPRRHLHHAGVPGVSLRFHRTEHHGALHDAGLHLRGSGDGALQRGARARSGHRASADQGHLDHRRALRRVRDLRRAPGGGLDRAHPGDGAPPRRAAGLCALAQRHRRLGGIHRSLRRQAPHRPAVERPRNAVAGGVLRRALDPEHLLLGAEPVHHPAHPRGAEPRRGTAGDALRGGHQGHDPLPDHHARYHGGPALSRPHQDARPGLPRPDPRAGAGRACSGSCSRRSSARSSAPSSRC